MVSIPLEWTLRLKGGNEVKTTLESLNQSFKRGEISREEYNKALAAGNREATRSISVGRYQNNIMLAQYPNLVRVSRALSTVTSISRTLLTISNALNISNISRNTADSGLIDTQNLLNAALRERVELEANGLKGSKEWIENEEEINVLTAQVQEKLKEINDQKFDGIVTAVEGAILAVSTTMNLLIKNKTILNALTKAGTLFGGVFSGFFTFISNAVIKAGGWITSALGIGTPAGKAAALGGTRLGTIFGLSFAGAVSVAIIAVGAAILAGAVDIMMENVSGQSFVRDLTEKLLGKGQGMSTKDILGLNVHKGADISGQGIFGGPNSYEEYIGENNNFFQPLIDLFTKGLPEAYGENEKALNESMSVNIPETILTNAPIIIQGFKDMWNGVISITNTAGAGLIAGVNQIFGELITSMNKAIASYNKAAKKMGKSTIAALSFTPSIFTNIPFIAAAKGFDGMVNSPTMFLAGEAGPEQVSITPNGRSSGSNTVVINVAGSVITEKKLAYMVDQYQKQNLKSRGFTGFG